MALISPPPDDLLIRYLFGELPPPETERFDEQSVADREFFERLDAVENDLIDGFVRGELPPDVQERFRVRYLTNEVRAQKVRFASALARREKRPAHVVPMKPRASRTMPWLLPLAATIAVVGLGLWFLPENRVDGPASPGTPRVAEAPPAESPGTPRLAVPDQNAPAPTARDTVFAFSLAAPRRDADTQPPITIPADAGNVRAQLELEIDDFPGYRAALKSTASERVLWRSGVLTSERQGASTVVPVLIPARHFEAQRYVIELVGVTAAGSAEPVAAYAFRVNR